MENSEERIPEQTPKSDPAIEGSKGFLHSWRSGLKNWADKNIPAEVRLVPIGIVGGAGVGHELAHGEYIGAGVATAITAGVVTGAFYAKDYLARRREEREKKNNK